MKKWTILIISLLLLFALSGCNKTLTSPDGLIEKARKEIPISQADSIDIEIAGSIEKDNGKALIWFVSGNEYQAHYYLPMECIMKDNDKYEYVQVYKPMDRAMDVVVLNWQNGYAFLVNNENCKSIRITDETGTHNELIASDSYPYIFYNESIPSQYEFLDSTGNELN